MSINKIAYSMIIAGLVLVSISVFAGRGDPHHAPVEPVVYITNEVTYQSRDLGNALNAISAISSVPSLSCQKLTCTGLGAGFSGYDGSGSALVLEHVEGVMSYRGGIGFSGGEGVFQFGVMGQFK